MNDSDAAFCICAEAAGTAFSISADAVAVWTEHITPILRDTLHWLRVSQEITYKITLMAFNCIHRTHPAYFIDVYNPVDTVAGCTILCSAAHADVIVPPTHTKKHVLEVSMYPDPSLGVKSVKSETLTSQETRPGKTAKVDGRIGKASMSVSSSLLI